MYSRTCLKQPLKNRQTKVFKPCGSLMKGKRTVILDKYCRKHYAILLTCIKRLSVLKTVSEYDQEIPQSQTADKHLFWSSFEWLLKTGFTLHPLSFFLKKSWHLSVYTCPIWVYYQNEFIILVIKIKVL